MSKKDRQLNREVSLKFQLERRIKPWFKKYTNGFKYVIPIGVGLHFLRAIPEYKFNIFRMSGTCLSMLIFYTLFKLILTLYGSGFEISSGFKNQYEELSDFSHEYMKNKLSNGDITKDEYDRFFDINKHL